MQLSKFFLRFKLLCYVDGSFEYIDHFGASVGPIEVVSHSLYLHCKQGKQFSVSCISKSTDPPIDVSRVYTKFIRSSECGRPSHSLLKRHTKEPLVKRQKCFEPECSSEASANTLSSLAHHALKRSAEEINSGLILPKKVSNDEDIALIALCNARRGLTGSGSRVDAAFTRTSIVIEQQPPPQAVYHRILKPWPTVRITAPDEVCKHLSSSLMVEVELIRCDTGQVIRGGLVGTNVIPYRAGQCPSDGATGYRFLFKKLKAIFTSQRYGGMFALRFCLRGLPTKSATKKDPVANTELGSLVSEPFVIFSHSKQLQAQNNRTSQACATAATCAEKYGASISVL